MKIWDEELEVLRQKDRYRAFKIISSKQGAEVIINGKKLINFSSNNYLGLAQNPKVKQAAIAAIKEFGTGAESARLLSGHTSAHEELEEAIAKFKGTQKALVFSTGYMANVGTISTIAGEKDLLILDRLNHASLFEGAFLSKARIWIYSHRDVSDLNQLLQKAAQKSFRRIWVVTESLFSMDGDIAPLPSIVKLCKLHGAFLMIDEAHATGVLGKTGQGALEFFSIEPSQVDIMMGTLSKALGSLGGFIAGSSGLVEYLKNKTKSFIFTTALPPSICAAALKAIQIVKENSLILKKLENNTFYFRNGLISLGIKLSSDVTPIIPVVVGSDKETMAMARILEGQGVFAPGIRPPTVPEGEGRIRFSLTAAHTRKQLDRALEAMEKCRRIIQKFAHAG